MNSTIRIGDVVTVVNGTVDLCGDEYDGSERGVVENIKYDAVANDYVVSLAGGAKRHFYRFQLNKVL